MSDAFFDLMGQGGTGRQPITNVGRVAYNLRLDQDGIEARKLRGASASIYPFSSMEDRSFWVLPNDICLAEKTSQSRVRKQTDGLITVFSVLNGYFSENKDMVRIIESLTFAGLAGQGAQFDTRGNFPRHPEFTGIFGGLKTIVNTGNERIKNGQLVYWDIPHPSTLPNSSEHPNRITAVVRPYTPSKQSVTERAVKSRINAMFSPGSAPAGADAFGSVTTQAALRFMMTALQLTTNAYAALMASGLVKFDANALENSSAGSMARQINARNWTALGPAKQEAYLVKLAAGIGCRDMHTESASAGLYTVSDSTKTVKQHICELLTFEQTLVGYTHGDAIPSGQQGELLRNQEAVIRDLLAAVDRANHFIGDRVFARALTPAAPGKEFVGILGHKRQ